MKEMANEMAAAQYHMKIMKWRIVMKIMKI